MGFDKEGDGTLKQVKNPNNCGYKPLDLQTE